jgi:ATP-dependent Clp protease ATP-binding subunit ClpB
MMTTNANDEATYQRVKHEVMSVVGRHFRPEFINRIDETVVFHPLMASQIRGIAYIQIASLNKRLQYNDLSIEVSDAVLDRIANLGYDPVYGARPLRRAIQNWLENPLAQQVIKGEYVAGDCILVDVNEDGFSFGKRTGDVI